jgi:hypothetical protein
VLKAGGNDVAWADGGVEKRYTLSSMPLGAAMAIAQPKLPEELGTSILSKTAVLLFDREGDRELAKQLCQQAAQRGLPVEELRAELKSEPAAARKASPGSRPAKPPEQERRDVPDADAQVVAMREIHKLFELDYAAAKEREPKRILARFLMGKAEETRDNPTARFVLYVEARDMAVAAGDSALLMNIVTAVGREYRLDWQTMAAETLIKAAKKPRDAASNQPLGRLALEMAKSAAGREDYDRARLLAEAGREMARKARDGPTIKRIVALAKDVDQRDELRTAFAEAQKLLAAKPADPEANQTVGRYYCLVKNDWARGLPLVAKGADEELKNVVATEIAHAVSSPAEMVNLGDRWYDAAKAVDESNRYLARVRAAYWYQRALPNVTGLTQSKVERRVAELSE